jgi:hypothetical protein
MFNTDEATSAEHLSKVSGNAGGLKMWFISPSNEAARKKIRDLGTPE